MQNNTLYQNASYVRKNWSTTIDAVVHERPAFITRTRDKVVMADYSLMDKILNEYKFHLTLEKEEDGSVTGYLEELQLVENGATKADCVRKMIAGMVDYAMDYYSEFSYWSKAPNRISHIPYVMKLLICSDEKIREDLICQDGKN